MAKKKVKEEIKSRAKADHIKKAKKPAKQVRVVKPAVSVEAMIEENAAATVSTDYQKYLRKLMKRAGK